MSVLIEIALSTVLFILMWVFVGNGVFKSVFELLEERERKTIGSQKKSIAKREEMIHISAQIEDRLRQARAGAGNLRDDKVTVAKAQAQRKIDEEHASEESRLEAARAQLAGVKQQAMRDVESEARALSQAVVGKVTTLSSSSVLH